MPLWSHALRTLHALGCVGSWHGGSGKIKHVHSLSTRCPRISAQQLIRLGEELDCCAEARCAELPPVLAVEAEVDGICELSDLRAQWVGGLGRTYSGAVEAGAQLSEYFLMQSLDGEQDVAWGKYSRSEAC